MTENNNSHSNWSSDDLLLEQFFQTARSEQLADKGFSHRVMARLPERQMWLSRIWTAACIAVALAVFSFFDGWQKVAAAIFGVLTTTPTTTLLLQLMACGAVVTALVASELIRHERLSLDY